jgi:hypothetical protein
VGDGELAPGFIDGGVEETEFKVALDCDVLCKPVGVAGRRFDEDILTIEA